MKRKIDRLIVTLHSLSTAAKLLAEGLETYENVEGNSTGYDAGKEMATFRYLAPQLPQATEVIINAKRFLDEKLERSQRARATHTPNQGRQRIKHTNLLFREP